MQILRGKMIICAIVLSLAVQVKAEFVKRIVGTDVSDPDSKDISLAFDCNNSPLIAYTPQRETPIVIAHTKEKGYEFDTVTEQYYRPYINLEVTSNNEQWMTIGEIFAAKSSWFDWTFSIEMSESVANAAISDNDILHTVVWERYGRLYHQWFDPKSNTWIKHFIADNSIYPSIDTYEDKVLISLYLYNRGYFVVLKEEDNYNYLQVLNDIDYPVSFKANFDNDGCPAVAYSKGENLIYTVYINDIIGWVETETDIDCDYVLRLDHSSTGTPGIAYTNNGKLYYASNIAGIWTSVFIDRLAWGMPDFKFDKNDKPVIAYVGYDVGLHNSVLKLAGTDIPPYNIIDIDESNAVNFTDFALFVSQWGQSSDPQQERLSADFDGNGEVDQYDLRNFSCNWLWEAEDH